MFPADPLKFILNCFQVEKDIVEIIPKKGIVGKTFKKDAQIVNSYLSNMNEKDIAEMEAQFADKG